MAFSEVERAFAKTPNLGFLLVNKYGIVKFINKKFEHVFALERKKYCGVKLNALIGEVAELKTLKSFGYLKNLSRNTSDFVIRKDAKYLRLNISNILESGRDFDGFIVTLSDITHEKELEYKEMEHERMLIAHAKMATMGEMINSISHQQRQPLSSILLSLDNIQECVKTGEFKSIKEYIALCKSSVKLMDETIGAFRNFYRNDTKLSTVDLKNIIKELVLITKPQMNAHGILLEFKCEEGDFIINTVASYVKQILISLLANAKDELIDLAHRDMEFEPKIRIELQNCKDEVCIDVSDNGRGVRSDKDKIFEPFFTTKKNTGTGMGLYVARILAVERLKGRLVLKNAKNPTQFSLFLKIL